MKPLIETIWFKIRQTLLFFIFSFLIFSTNGFTSTKPERILSLSPSLTEILFAVGAGPQVIAVDNYSTYPPEAPITQLSSFEPNMEAIASFNPDLVLLSYDIGNIIKGLNIIGIETMLLPAPMNFEEILDQIRNVGERTGNIKQANKLANDMNSQMKNLVTLMKSKSQKKLYSSFLGNVD